ncbi:hypothetical protein [Amycolatopsis palatopharyngis]|uniref:hypothetical protein n=1 Tax=Amycolatopsis palatopharyngis TaxID=187982 RepID=UPI000E264A79|nr:hypothetical protein [Amycolatopsis palatopharyngis]
MGVIEHVRVDPEYLRRGYGRVLVAGALARGPGYRWSTTAVIDSAIARASGSSPSTTRLCSNSEPPVGAPTFGSPQLGTLNPLQGRGLCRELPVAGDGDSVEVTSSGWGGGAGIARITAAVAALATARRQGHNHGHCGRHC